MAPFVSIIIPCYNQAQYLERSVRSVLSQTFTDLECIIVNDGSTDNTHEVGEYLCTIDSRVKYFFKENGGLSVARNFGISKAQGEWIQCLDSDDWIHEDKTRFQLEHLKGLEDEDVIFYSDYERVYIEREENIIKREEKFVGSLTREQLIERLLMPDFLANSPFPLLQQCLLIKRSIFDKKLFEPNLKALMDRDFPLAFLGAESGVKFIYTPIIGAYYTRHMSNMTNNWNYMKNDYISFYAMIKNKYNQYFKYCQTPLEFFLDETLREKDKSNFERLAVIAEFPVHLLEGKITINNLTSLRMAYWLRLITPSFILYEKYRGPRSKKLISIWSKLFKLEK